MKKVSPYAEGGDQRANDAREKRVAILRPVARKRSLPRRRASAALRIAGLEARIVRADGAGPGDRVQPRGQGEEGPWSSAIWRACRLLCRATMAAYRSWCRSGEGVNPNWRKGGTGGFTSGSDATHPRDP